MVFNDSRSVYSLSEIKKCRYLIECTRHVSGITYMDIRYAQSQKIGNLYNLKVFESKKTPALKQVTHAWRRRNLVLIITALFSTRNFNNKYIWWFTSVPKHWLLGGWYHRKLIFHQQKYQSSDSNKNIDI